MSMNIASRIVPWRGVVLDIHTAPTGGAPMVAAEAVNAVAGRGIEGDRYYEGTGFYSWFTGPIRHISLIEWEVLETLREFHDLPLQPGVTRRNIVTRGVPLGHLLNREFRVGGATLRGVEICEPCKHLVDLTGNRSLLSALIHRGGLHAEIVASGTIRPGDMIEATDPGNQQDGSLHDLVSSTHRKSARLRAAGTESNRRMNPIPVPVPQEVSILIPREDGMRLFVIEAS